MSPEEHDRALAVTSHVPHLAAAALAATLPESWFRLAGLGALDTTRIASGDPEIWTHIFLQNRDNVLTALGKCERELSALRAAIEKGDEEKLKNLLAVAKKNRDALGS
jgi:prephenate dehydrogenase